jgi:hypothetical protein
VSNIALNEFLNMTVTGKGAISAVLALFLGFSMSFIVRPDPTGTTPILRGQVLTGVLSPIFYFGLRRTISDQQISS